MVNTAPDSGRRIRRRWLRRRCRMCGADVIRIAYGYPTRELLDRHALGEVALGGCVVQSDSPSLACRECGWIGRYAPRLRMRRSWVARMR